MRLFEHPDFEQAILQAAEHFRTRGLRPAIIEKDYYVTEALRIIASTVGEKTIFKGGTKALFMTVWWPSTRSATDHAHLEQAFAAMFRSFDE